MSRPEMTLFIIIMIRIFCIGLTVIKVVIAQPPQPSRTGDEWYKEQWPPQPYSFGYEIRDYSGNEQYRKEVSDGARVTGSYGYLGPDGVYRHVEYVADENGFRASIRTTEPGTSNEPAADVTIEANPLIVPQNTPTSGGRDPAPGGARPPINIPRDRANPENIYRAGDEAPFADRPNRPYATRPPPQPQSLPPPPPPPPVPRPVPPINPAISRDVPSLRLRDDIPLDRSGIPRNPIADTGRGINLGEYNRPNVVPYRGSRARPVNREPPERVDTRQNERNIQNFNAYRSNQNRNFEPPPPPPPTSSTYPPQRFPPANQLPPVVPNSNYNREYASDRGYQSPSFGDNQDSTVSSVVGVYNDEYARNYENRNSRQYENPARIGTNYGFIEANKDELTQRTPAAVNQFYKERGVSGVSGVSGASNTFDDDRDEYDRNSREFKRRQDDDDSGADDDTSKYRTLTQIANNKPVFEERDPPPQHQIVQQRTRFDSKTNYNNDLNKESFAHNRSTFDQNQGQDIDRGDKKGKRPPTKVYVTNGPLTTKTPSPVNAANGYGRGQVARDNKRVTEDRFVKEVFGQRVETSKGANDINRPQRPPLTPLRPIQKFVDDKPIINGRDPYQQQAGRRPPTPPPQPSVETQTPKYEPPITPRVTRPPQIEQKQIPAYDTRTERPIQQQHEEQYPLKQPNRPIKPNIAQPQRPSRPQFDQPVNPQYPPQNSQYPITQQRIENDRQPPQDPRQQFGQQLIDESHQSGTYRTPTNTISTVYKRNEPDINEVIIREHFSNEPLPPPQSSSFSITPFPNAISEFVSQKIDYHKKAIEEVSSIGVNTTTTTTTTTTTSSSPVQSPQPQTPVPEFGARVHAESAVTKPSHHHQQQTESANDFATEEYAESDDIVDDKFDNTDEDQYYYSDDDNELNNTNQKEAQESNSAKSFSYSHSISHDSSSTGGNEGSTSSSSNHNPIAHPINWQKYSHINNHNW